MPKGPARQEARRHRWFSEEISGFQKAFPRQAQQNGLVVGQGASACLAVAQMVRQSGQARGRRAWGVGAAASHFGTTFLLPWVSHFVQPSKPKEAGEALFTTQQTQPQGKGEG